MEKYNEQLALSEQLVRPLYIEGYTDQLSYEPGDEIGFHISTSASQYALEIARLGAEREVVWSEKELPGAAYPIPEDASSHGCRWPISFTLRVPDTWRSGYYVVTMRVEDRGGHFTHRNRRTAEGGMFFVVRSGHPGRDTKILIQLATNSYNAYNNWGGYSLYAYHGRSNLQGHRVSFNRPMAGYFSNWELPFVAWAERNGYILDYAANTDLEFHPEILNHYRLVLSVGHDEYWSAKMRDHLEGFIADGGNVAFFSGNSVCWQVRCEEGGRALVCWKQGYNQDPVYKTDDHRLLSTLWSHYLVERPENQLTGVGFLYGGYHLSHGQFMDGSGAYTVHRPEHWAFEGTGLKPGDTFGGNDTIVGYECDGCEFRMEDGLPVPTHQDGTPDSFVILCTAPVRWHPGDCEWYERWEKGRTGAATMGIYTSSPPAGGTEGGGTVLTAATTDWSHGLRGRDAIVERITRNVLNWLSQ
ncbi:hypothetical protein HYR99_32980 [Candidatus Poribacteria bacterium]|nr:hypothetical protein [Candidatus Poribacteria bacterium]